MLESRYQSELKAKIKKVLPNALILKTDPTYLQGFPDLLILNGQKWAALEVKKDAKAKHRPNQELYIQKINEMGSYASFIFPENEKDIINELERSITI